MFYLISFILIILFVIETWKSTKTLQYYKDFYTTNNDIKDSFNNTSQDYENSNHIKKDSIFRHGYLPSNYAESSNFSLEEVDYSTDSPNMSKDEIINSQKNKFATSYPSEMTYNLGYFNPKVEKYIWDRKKIPLKWKCQREWNEYCS